MDYAACNVVFVDRAAKEDRLVKREDALPSPSSNNIQNHTEGHALARQNSSTLDVNLQTLLATFSEVHVCTSGKSCVAKLSELNQASIVDLIPTLVLIDIPYEDQIQDRPSRDIRTPSPSSKLQIEGILAEPDIEETYGLKLLQWIATEIQYHSLSKLVVPVAVVAIPHHNSLEPPLRERSGSNWPPMNYESSISGSRKQSGLVVPLDQVRTMRYLDIGAVDVLTSPLLQERLPSLGIHAYRAHRDASKDQRALLEMKRGRKRSWVGVDDAKPYAYLREAMVSGLMDGICKLGGDDEPFGHMRISVAPERREKIAESIGSWHFSAHDYTDDELLHAALLMLQHALTMPELERWRISTENLTAFLVASRSAYNAFVPYHNFRHVVDVLQAIFHFLVQLGRLPQYPLTSSKPEPAPSPIASFIRPFDALTLLITAIGHDVGHPGVNNAFLVTLNAPLAQLYNDRSVLESFHCAAYSQILRRHWPAAFQGVEMRQLMISSILATDMGLHFDYMKKLGYLQEKLHENKGTDGWNGRLIEEQRTLACSLLIKCADISNVARRYDVAAQWTMILTDEFSRQASMEQDLGIPTALFAAPVRETIELGKSQIGFMNMFAIPLFQGVTDVMPGMEFCVDELHRNKSRWEEKIAEEQERNRQDIDDPGMMDGMFSPRNMSIATPSDASHQKIGNPPPLGRSNTDSMRIKAMLGNFKSPFPPRNPRSDETAELGHFNSSSGISQDPFNPPSSTPSPGQVSPEQGSPEGSRRSSKPSQLQLSYATSSAPALLDHPANDKALNGIEPQLNGLEVQPSLVTDPVIVDPPPSEESPKTKTESHQRISDTTESSHSAGGDWASQATSATTNRMPLSPSTQGTSLMSEDRESLEKSSTPTAAASPLPSNNSQLTNSTASTPRRTDETDSREGRAGEGESKGVLETVRILKKKPSRFRMNSLTFWKRSKSSSPPSMPGKERREDEGQGPGLSHSS